MTSSHQEHATCCNTGFSGVLAILMQVLFHKSKITCPSQRMFTYYLQRVNVVYMISRPLLPAKTTRTQPSFPTVIFRQKGSLIQTFALFLKTPSLPSRLFPSTGALASTQTSMQAPFILLKPYTNFVHTKSSSMALAS